MPYFHFFGWQLSQNLGEKCPKKEKGKRCYTPSLYPVLTCHNEHIKNSQVALKIEVGAQRTPLESFRHPYNLGHENAVIPLGLTVPTISF